MKQFEEVMIRVQWSELGCSGEDQVRGEIQKL